MMATTGRIDPVARPPSPDAPPDLTAALARNVLDLSYDRLSDSDRLQLKRLVFDHLAVCRRGAEAPWSRAVQDYARALETGGAAVDLLDGFGRGEG